jgi:putative transposase
MRAIVGQRSLILKSSLAEHYTLYISEKIKGEFAVLPKRWVVERTFAWLGKFRRLAKDYEILTASAENRGRIAMLKITLAKCT